VLQLVISCSTATPCYTNKAALQLASLASEMLTPLLSQSKPMYLTAQGARACGEHVRGLKQREKCNPEIEKKYETLTD
jgi:hypothetical protein